MISGRNIIAIASNWNFDPTSKHHIMKILSQQNRVLWVNYHGSRRPQVTGQDFRSIVAKLRQFTRGPEQVSENLTVLTPLVIPFPGSRVVRAINRRLMVRQIRAVLARFPRQPVQLWSFAPDVDYLVGEFDEELDLYYCVDEFSAFSTYDRETILQLERTLIRKCDLVITTARPLQDSKAVLHPNTHLVLHGVSYDHFASATEDYTAVPDNVKNISAPIFGYFGMIQDWFDQPLLVELARRHPDWSFVLLGKAEVSVEAFRSLPNVHLLGQVPFASLPGYCKAFDVGLIPFVINPLTIHVNPIKLREYLAAGLPVVSTDLPEVRAYQPYVRIGRSVDEFERACMAALQERTLLHRRRRQESVRCETWEGKVEQLSRLVVATLEGNDSIDPPEIMGRDLADSQPTLSVQDR